MSGKKAKLLRRLSYAASGVSNKHRAYGQMNVRNLKTPLPDGSSELRKTLLEKGYKILAEKVGKVIKDFVYYATNTVVCDEIRQGYKANKKFYKSLPWNLRRNVS